MGAAPTLAFAKEAKATSTNPAATKNSSQIERFIALRAIEREIRIAERTHRENPHDVQSILNVAFAYKNAAEHFGIPALREKAWEALEAAFRISDCMISRTALGEFSKWSIESGDGIAQKLYAEAETVVIPNEAEMLWQIPGR